MTKQEKEKQKQELIAEIFAAFEKIDANVEQPVSGGNLKVCSWVQAKPVIKGQWKYFTISPDSEFEIKTILIYFTTFKILIQGKGNQVIIKCTKDNLIPIISTVIEIYCKDTYENI